MLHYDRYHVFTHSGAQRIRGGKLLCPLVDNAGAAHANMPHIIHLCCSMFTIMYQTHYELLRVRGGKMLSSLPEKHHRAHMRLGGIIYALRMLYEDHYHTLCSLWGSSAGGGGKMPCSLPGERHRRMKLIHAFGLRLHTLSNPRLPRQWLYGARRDTQTRMRVETGAAKCSAPCREHCIGCTCTSWYYRHHLL
jgi:hypothetical protein